jgi:hypothetical protein
VDGAKPTTATRWVPAMLAAPVAVAIVAAVTVSLTTTSPLGDAIGHEALLAAGLLLSALTVAAVPRTVRRLAP